MANRDGTCIICGASPTVKMHIFPRSMMFRIRGDEKHLVAGDRIRKGVRFRQSGIWDDRVLCAKHESAFASADDYAIEICRRIESEARPIETGDAFELANPHPDRLVRFASATVWRQVVSTEGRQLDLNLGPYRKALESYLFSGGPVPVQILIGRANLTMPDGRPIEIAIAPYRNQLLQWNVWHFTMGPLDVFLKADRRQFPASWGPYLANDNDPLTLIAMNPMRFDQIPKFQAIFRNMRMR